MFRNRVWTVVSSTALAIVAQARSAIAQNLPEQVLPENTGTDDFIGIFDGVFQQGLEVFIFLLIFVGFLIVAWSSFSKFNECRQGRAEWSELGVTAGVGAAVLIFATIPVSYTHLTLPTIYSV